MGFWHGSGISWTLYKQSASRSRLPHQHLMTQFLQAGCSYWRPTNSVKALKAIILITVVIIINNIRQQSIYKVPRWGQLLPMFHCLTVCLFDIRVSCVKPDEPIEMLFVMWTRVGSGNDALREGPDSLWRRDILGMQSFVKILWPLRPIRTDHYALAIFTAWTRVSVNC